MKIRFAFAVASLLIATPATARVEYSTYEGPDAIQMGEGGARFEKDGIDYWTRGTPHRRFQVLGFITDSRKDGWLNGRAVGSPDLAKRAKAAGGDALILLEQGSKSAGVVGTISSWGWGLNMFGRQINRITTMFAVVRYLDDNEGTVSTKSILLPQAPQPVLPSKRTIEIKKVPADTPSGFCLEVPADYVGTGSASRPAITKAMPRCG